MKEVLGELATERRIFHSEADFQHALAWKIREELEKRDKEFRIRLEYKHPALQTEQNERPERRYL
ncbi:MAG: hypothetical protein KGZ25_08855, partial [Planctomycetes bacterium]|nr:hypothetical protein [Planctomycetota bacterium]